MVETSVAVATPSTTAARIRNGSASAGSAMRKARPICAPARAFDMAELLAAIAPANDEAEQDGAARWPAAGRR